MQCSKQHLQYLVVGTRRAYNKQNSSASALLCERGNPAHRCTLHLTQSNCCSCLWTGNARLVDQDEPGFERLSSTSSSTISASTRRGSVHRNVPSGVNSWRRLRPVKDAPLDDDDDDSKFALRPHHVSSKYGRHPICGR